MDTTTNNVLQTALSWHSKGFTPIPVKPKSKAAATPWKKWQERLPPPALIRAWFEKYSHRNLGLICGGSGNLLVLDFDYVPAYIVWRKDNPEYAQTYTVRTRDGFHAYFICEKKVSTKIGVEGVDIKGNGYVLAPPSIHPSGAEYKVHVDGKIMKIDALEDVFMVRVTPTASPLSMEDGIVGKSQESSNKSNLLHFSTHTERLGGAKRPQVITVKDIKERLPILDFVRMFTQQVEPSNDGFYTARCPFHHPDRHPSFWINPKNDLCGCFKPECQHGQPEGKPMDLINFYCRLFGVDNKTAIEQIKHFANL